MTDGRNLYADREGSGLISAPREESLTKVFSVLYVNDNGRMTKNWSTCENPDCGSSFFYDLPVFYHVVIVKAIISKVMVSEFKAPKGWNLARVLWQIPNAFICYFTPSAVVHLIISFRGIPESFWNMRFLGRDP
jgi:hypothetical protein